VLLDNAERLDKLVNGPELTEPDRAGVELDTWRGMMAKNDEIRQNLIPLSKQYMTLAAAQADIANIPMAQQPMCAVQMAVRWLMSTSTTAVLFRLPGVRCHLNGLWKSWREIFLLHYLSLIMQ
jgi:hypothetical protein